MASSDTSAHRKARGAFFTPPEITRYIANWAVRASTDRVLEPSCGDAEFLLAAGSRLRELGAGLFAGEQLNGVELHAPSAQVALERVHAAGLSAAITVSDFFDVSQEQRFEAVIGNPPYVRYQDFAGSARAKALEAALKQGVRLSGLASSWAAFTVHACEFLAPNGRLGLVLPAELLSVKYAAEVRRFLLQRFGTIRLVMFEELVFPDVQEEVVLLLAEGEGPAPHFEVYQARDLAELRTIERDAWIPYTPGGEDKWMRALLPSDAAYVYRELLLDGPFDHLSDWGNTYLGVVTGNNKFFAMTGEEVRAAGLNERELLRISPPGSRHLRGLTFTEAVWRALEKDARKTHLFYPRAEPSKAAFRYIEAGERAGVHNGYKCSNRDPWWRVPLVSAPDLLLTYMDRERPRLITNRAGAYHLNSLYGVKLHAGRKRAGMDLLALASLNSATMLGAEVVGRAYGGGMLKLEPREADKLPMPGMPVLEEKAEQLRALRPQVAAAMRKGDLHEATRMVDRVVLHEGAGLTHAQVRALRDARNVLFQRRDTRAGANG